MKTITLEALGEIRADYLKDEKARVVRNALTRNDINTISRVFEAENASPFMFSKDIKTMTATSQEQSGRCWIFSALNVMRQMIANRYGIESFELSQNYIAFYDKLEKSNYFMEAMIAEIDSPMDSPVMRHLLTTGVHDGGQWDMLVSLVKKYGLCPKSAMGETFQSSATRGMNGLLNKRLKKFAVDIREIGPAEREEKLPLLKAKCLKECYGLIASCFGLPPQEFTFEYYDKDRKYHSAAHVKPLDFYREYLAQDLDDYIVLINGPTADKPYRKMYTVKYLGNVAGGNPVSFLNLEILEFKELILKQLQDDELVWFGCDCGKEGDRKTGLWDDGQYDYEHTFDMDLSMTKAQMLDSGYSAMNHAMVFTGVHIADDKPVRWKIENSWGEGNGRKGYFTCTDTWFDKYVYEAVVRKEYLSEELQAVLKEEPKVLDPWDPFGSLAQ
ncbi:MAG: C1 family peptidase [Solobacterium sp.]|nr:C1 family peptidase [Solobacterium sp.]